MLLSFNAFQIRNNTSDLYFFLPSSIPLTQNLWLVIVLFALEKLLYLQIPPKEDWGILIYGILELELVKQRQQALDHTPLAIVLLDTKK